MQPLLTKYFQAANERDFDGQTTCFAEDARVYDEAEDHVGRAAIRAWIEETTQKYDQHLTVLGSRERDGNEVVTARVEGSFPGSPIELDFVFTLREGMIAALKVE